MIQRLKKSSVQHFDAGKMIEKILLPYLGRYNATILKSRRSWQREGAPGHCQSDMGGCLTLWLVDEPRLP